MFGPVFIDDIGKIYVLGNTFEERMKYVQSLNTESGFFILPNGYDYLAIGTLDNHKIFEYGDLKNLFSTVNYDRIKYYISELTLYSNYLHEKYGLPDILNLNNIDDPLDVMFQIIDLLNFILSDIDREADIEIYDKYSHLVKYFPNILKNSDHEISLIYRKLYRVYTLLAWKYYLSELEDYPKELDHWYRSLDLLTTEKFKNRLFNEYYHPIKDAIMD